MMKILAFIFAFNVYVSASLKTRTSCQPFPVMVPTYSENYADSYIIVHQCRGRSDDPVINPNKQCVNKTAEPMGRVIDGVEVYNHTSCNMSIVCRNDHTKNVKNIRSGVCYFHEKWNAATCKCEMKIKTIKCIPIHESSSLIQSKLLGIALFVEFIGLMIIAYLVWRWRKNIMNIINSARSCVQDEINESCFRFILPQRQNENDTSEGNEGMLNERNESCCAFILPPKQNENNTSDDNEVILDERNESSSRFIPLEQ